MAFHIECFQHLSHEFSLVVFWKRLTLFLIIKFSYLCVKYIGSVSLVFVTT